MNETLWEPPVPSTAFLRGVSFKVLPKRQCSLSFEIEDESGGMKRLSLVFGGVEAFKCTYRSSIEAGVPRLAYDKLIDRGKTDWQESVTGSFEKYAAMAKIQSKTLRHLMVYFDDGPCYEIICEGFRQEEAPFP